MASKVWGPENEAEDVPRVESVTDLGEIADWLGTFRERLKQAHDGDRERLASQVTRWTIRYQQRRSELA